MDEPIAGAVRRRPLEQIRAEPWSFILAAMGLGFGLGFLLRFPKVRKGLQVLSLARRMTG